MFNGLFASGDDVSLAATKTIEKGLMTAYEENKEHFVDSDKCKAMYIEYGCIGAVNHPDFPAATPCSSNGGRLKICKGLCVKYLNTCSKLLVTGADALVDKTCADMSAPEGDECFGDAGVLGMKSAAHQSVPPFFAVAFLALAACLATDFKYDVY